MTQANISVKKVGKTKWSVLKNGFAVFSIEKTSDAGHQLSSTPSADFSFSCACIDLADAKNTAKQMLGINPLDKKTFVISESQSSGSYREGTKIQATSLTAAKVIATKNQVFQNTYLKIENEAGDVLSIKYNKYAGNKWRDSNA